MSIGIADRKTDSTTMYAGKPPPPSELALVFDSPVNFDTFVRIMVPLDAASGAADSSRAADDTSQHARARLVCEQLNALEADASFVAWPCSETHVQVMCQKVGWKQGAADLCHSS